MERSLLKTAVANNNPCFKSKIAKEGVVVKLLCLYDMQCSNIFHLLRTPFTTSWERTDEVLIISPRCVVTRGENQICPARGYFTLCWHTYSRWLLMTHNLHTKSQACPLQYIFHILKHVPCLISLSWLRWFLQIRLSINATSVRSFYCIKTKRHADEPGRTM